MEKDPTLLSGELLDDKKEKQKKKKSKTAEYIASKFSKWFKFVEKKEEASKEDATEPVEGTREINLKERLAMFLGGKESTNDVEQNKDEEISDKETIFSKAKGFLKDVVTLSVLEKDEEPDNGEPEVVLEKSDTELKSLGLVTSVEAPSSGGAGYSSSVEIASDSRIEKTPSEARSIFSYFSERKQEKEQKKQEKYVKELETEVDDLRRDVERMDETNKIMERRLDKKDHDKISHDITTQKERVVTSEPNVSRKPVEGSTYHEDTPRSAVEINPKATKETINLDKPHVETSDRRSMEDTSKPSEGAVYEQGELHEGYGETNNQQNEVQPPVTTKIETLRPTERIEYIEKQKPSTSSDSDKIGSAGTADYNQRQSLTTQGQQEKKIGITKREDRFKTDIIIIVILSTLIIFTFTFLAIQLLS